MFENATVHEEAFTSADSEPVLELRIAIERHRSEVESIIARHILQSRSHEESKLAMPLPDKHPPLPPMTPNSQLEVPFARHPR